MFRQSTLLSVATMLTILAASLFSESPLVYVSSAVFVLILLMLLLNFRGGGVESCPSVYLFVYFFFFVYVLVFSLVLMLFYEELLPRSFLTSLFFPSLLLVSLLIFGRNPEVISVFKLGFFILFFFASFRVIYEYYSFFSQHGWSTQTNWTNFVGSSLTFLFLIRRITLVKVILLLGTIVIVFGLKRSGMLVLLVYWLIFIFIYRSHYNQSSPFNSIFIGFFISIGLLIFLYVFLFDSISPVIDRAWSRVESISEDGGSGRDRILLSGWSLWGDSDIFSQFFGHGHGAFQKISGQASSLHNDFSELVFSYGIFGFIFLFTIFFRLSFLAVIMYLEKSDNLSFCLATLFALFVYSNVSGIYYYPIFFCSLIVGYGYLEGSRAYLKKNPK